jgi:predicted permease
VFGINPQLRTSSNLETIRFFQSLLNRLQSLPGVEAVTLMGNRIGSGWSNNTTAVIDGKPADAAGANRSTSMRWNTVGPNYFTTLGAPILYGRDFTDSDSQDAPKVAIVNQTFAKRFLADREPLGHQVSFTSKTAYTIIGVVGNSKYTSVRERDIPMAYFPYTQVGIGTGHFEVRTVGEPASFWPVIRKAVGALAPDVALLQPMTQRAQFDSSISEERLVARLAMFFGVVAIMLVATGLYGILAYSVSRRIYEIGIRMALGAQRSSVLWMVMRDSLVMGSIGILVGLPLVFASARLLTSLLYGLAPNDPLTICMALVGIASVTVAASLIPARRAASVDPIRALKYE